MTRPSPKGHTNFCFWKDRSERLVDALEAEHHKWDKPEPFEHRDCEVCVLLRECKGETNE